VYSLGYTPSLTSYSSTLGFEPPTRREDVCCAGCYRRWQQCALAPTLPSLLTAILLRALLQTLDNLTVMLTAAGSSLSKLVKVTIYLLDNFSAVNAVYSKHLPAHSLLAPASLSKRCPWEL
jgi:hypothetical protein